MVKTVTKPYKRFLKSQNLWPEEFDVKEQSEDQEDNDEEEEDNDADIFINTNRRPCNDETDSSDSES